MIVDHDQLVCMQQTLAHGDADGRWLRLLEVFLAVGLADMHQLQAATGFSRDQINRLLEKYRQAAAGGPPILVRYAGRLPRPWRPARGANVYLLGAGGAALLSAAGHNGVRPCGLQEPTALLHALAVLEVRLAAQAAGLSVATEQEVVNAAGQALRPDNLVQLPAGPALLFEVEQVGRPELLRRIVEGVRRRVRFFAGAGERPISPVVRLLFALPRDATCERTLRLWARVVAAVAEEAGGALPCRFLALPLGEFLARPDWGEPPAADRWQDLGRLDLLTGRAMSSAGAPDIGGPRPAEAVPGGPADVSGPAAASAAEATALPAGLARYAGHESRLILRALWQHFLDHAGAPVDEAAPAADPFFFETMTLIYLASHDGRAPLDQRAGLPYASWFLLEHYLKLHSRLRAALQQELGRPGKMVWNASTIRFRLQRLAELFLAYHGYRLADDAPLFVCAEAVDLDVRTTRPFAFHVRIREPGLVAAGAAGGAVALAERALAWVLHTVAFDGERIGLRPAIFR